MYFEEECFIFTRSYNDFYFLSKQWESHELNTPDHQILRNLSQCSLGDFYSSSPGFQAFFQTSLPPQVKSVLENNNQSK